MQSLENWIKNKLSTNYERNRVFRGLTATQDPMYTFVICLKLVSHSVSSNDSTYWKKLKWVNVICINLVSDRYPQILILSCWFSGYLLAAIKKSFLCTIFVQPITSFIIVIPWIFPLICINCVIKIGLTHNLYLSLLCNLTKMF